MIRRAVLLSTITLLVACTAPPSRDTERAWEKEEPNEREIQAYQDKAKRMTTRILYVAETTPPSSPGQIAINYGQPKWKPEYEDKFDELTKGKRWRFGNNSWTSLDTNVAITLGGTEIGPGHYYLILERSLDDQWSLVLLNPERIRALKLDAFFVDEAPEGVKAPLAWRRTEEPVEALSVQLIPTEGDLNRARLEIRWGNHLLTGDIEIALQGRTG
jgi:hypothetical protein